MNTINNEDPMAEILREEELMNSILAETNQAQLLTGKEVAAAIMDDNLTRSVRLNSKKVQPTLAVFRVGERPDDVYYENSIKRHCAQVDIRCQTLLLPSNVTEKDFEAILLQTAQNPSVHGIFFFSPLPPSLDEARLRQLIPLEKDVDCLSRNAQAALYCGAPAGGLSFAPCTPAAVMAMLKHYQIPVKGKHAVVLGRSAVVGKPLAQLLLQADASVTVCHSKSEDLAQICWQADIVIAAAGRARLVKAEWLRPGQVVIDVGMNQDPEGGGQMCGDVDFDAAQQVVGAITPVPGGVGLVTTAILCQHVYEAAEYANRGK